MYDMRTEEDRVAEDLTVATIERLLEEGRFTEAEIAEQIRRLPMAAHYLSEAEAMGFGRGREEGIVEGRRFAYRDLLEARYGFRMTFPLVAKILSNLSRDEAVEILMRTLAVDDLKTTPPE